MLDKGGLVDFAAQGYGCEVRGVGFDEEAVGGDGFGDFAQGGRIAERDDSAEANHHAEGEDFLGERGGADEAVEDAEASDGGKGF